MFRVGHSSSLRYVLRQGKPPTRLRRYISTPVKQAYLEHLTAHPGISCLLLNRPQSKNAISLALLDVSHLCL